jgi:hypothetical protein
MRTRTWRAAAVVALTMSVPGLAAAQGSAVLYPRVWDTCFAQITDYSGALGTAQTRPLITDASSLVPVGQYVWVRWTLYREDHTIPSKGRVPVQTSNWWRGVAQPGVTPAQWFEYTLNPLTGGLVATLRSSLYQPSWAISKPLGPYGTTFYAMMEFVWEPLSNTGSPWPSKTVWAGGYCYWPYPR